MKNSLLYLFYGVKKIIIANSLPHKKTTYDLDPDPQLDKMLDPDPH